MKQPNTIEVSQAKDDTLTSQFITLYNTFRNVDANQPVVFDLTTITWVYPLVILPIASHAQAKKGECIMPAQNDVENYLSKIRFPEGVGTVSDMQACKSYIPIGMLQREGVLSVIDWNRHF